MILVSDKVIDAMHKKGDKFFTPEDPHQIPSEERMIEIVEKMDKDTMSFVMALSLDYATLGAMSAMEKLMNAAMAGKMPPMPKEQMN